jgi:hypothetical protein
LSEGLRDASGKGGLANPIDGHLEVLCGNAAEADVFAPTLEWLKRHAK